MFVSRSALEKPRPCDRLARTSSPSNTSTRRLRARKAGTSAPASVVLPAPDRPVNHSTNPFSLLMRNLVRWPSSVVSCPSVSFPQLLVLVSAAKLSEKRNGQLTTDDGQLSCGRFYLLRRALALGLDEHARHFGARELNWRQLARAQQLTHL